MASTKDEINSSLNGAKFEVVSTLNIPQGILHSYESTSKKCRFIALDHGCQRKLHWTAWTSRARVVRILFQTMQINTCQRNEKEKKIKEKKSKCSCIVLIPYNKGYALHNNIVCQRSKSCTRRNRIMRIPNNVSFSLTVTFEIYELFI